MFVEMRYWLAVLGCLLLAMGCSPGVEMEGSDEERAYDRLQRKSDWNGIVELNHSQPTHSLACHKVVVLAQYRLGMISQTDAYECLADSREVLASPLAAMMMSDVYIQLGMVNMAQRAAFEAMVKVSDMTKNERALRRLTETALITRQYELALKYIAVLEAHFGENEWFNQRRQMAEHPELIEQEPAFLQLRETYDNTEDLFFM